MVQRVVSLAGIKWNERPMARVDWTPATKPTIRVEIPRDRPIRTIKMRFFWKITNGGIAPTIKQDDVLNLIKKIRLLINGDDKKNDVSGKFAFFVEKNDKHTEPFLVKAPTAASAVATAEVVLHMDFASPKNKQDEGNIAEMLPAHRFSSVFLEVDAGLAADLASANAPTISETTNDSGIDIELREASGSVLVDDDDDLATPAKEMSVFALNYDDIREVVDTITIDKAYNSFDASTLTVNVRPSPAQIITNIFMAIDNNVRDNAIVTDLKLQTESPNVINRYQRRWKTLFGDQKAEYEMESIDTGVIYIDWEDTLEEGLITQGAETNHKFRFLTGAPTGTSQIQIYTRYISRGR